ncbi:MAG TPA: GNAT family N-acetyltransferase [Stellaceae bacterium]|nr:GNAT family N-acetyltransferase [Stellaceae bacterium]
MADGGDRLTVRIVERLKEVSQSAWDACAGGDNPFVSYAFLEALEASGSATARTGWLPQHLLLEDQAGRLLGAVPMYLKSHSYGEYVFDHGWAAALERAGGRYYPKLQVAVPFTPATGPRLLVHPEAPADTAELLIGTMVEVARRHKVSSLHVTFPTEREWTALGAAGFLQRMGRQFHWENQGYQSFEDFLGALNSRKRKQIRRERRDALAGGLEIEMLTGSALETRHWDAFFDFYISTSDRKWGSAYLTRGFFDLLGERLADRVLLVMVRQGRRYVAGALNLFGTDTIFGRNWGCRGDFPFLHFEACYYRAIDFAIARGLKRVEAGAQGQHKIQRGYLPCPTYSAHWIRDPGFARAVEDFLARERRAVEQEMDALEDALSPFRHEEAPAPD